MARMMGILSLAVFMFLVFSNVLVAFSTMYRAREVAYLVQAPMTFSDFFYARFFECVAFSSWSLAFLGAPLMLAYGLSTGVSPAFYVALIVFYLPYIIIPACIGAVVAMVLVRIFPRLNAKIMAGLAALVILLFFAYIYRTFKGAKVSEDTLLSVFLDATARTQSAFLPSHWAAQGVLAAARLDFREAGYWLLMLFSTALFALRLSGAAAAWLFYPGWSYLAGQDKQRFRLPGKGILGKLDGLLAFVRNPERALVVKDIKLFWRDPAQWSQFVIFFGIMAIYIANLRNTAGYREKEMWRSFIACLNVGAVSLILATLTSRFVFPLVSLEGRRFWILGLAPLTYKQLVWQKFWLSVATTSFFTVGLAVLSAYMLELETIYFVMTVYSTVMINFGLGGLAVGLGTLYPTFTEDNPARIVSGMGGTLNLLVSIGYISCVVGAQTFILQWHVLEKFTDPAFFWYALSGAVVFIFALTLVCTFVPMRLGLKNLDDMEF
jgi:ABC-2 type transport system permease protein